MNKMILLSTIAVCFLLAGCSQEGRPQQVGQSLSEPTPVNSVVSSKSAALSTSTISNGLTSSVQLKSILAKYTTHKIQFFQSISIGGKQTAAFAIVNGGDVWYITSSSAQKLKSDLPFLEGNPSDVPCLWTVDGTKIFKCESSAGGSSSASYAWYVKAGKPIELPYTGMDLSYVGNGQFTTIGDNFDWNFTDGIGTGHTYKRYYLYWATNGLKEYGGLKITLQQLLKMKGAQEIIDVITRSGHIIDDIFYRANNLININYHSGDKKNGNFDNVTLLYSNNTVTPELVYTGSNTSKTESFNARDLNDFSYGGIYQAALFPKIANYPNKFPIN